MLLIFYRPAEIPFIFSILLNLILVLTTYCGQGCIFCHDPIKFCPLITTLFYSQNAAVLQSRNYTTSGLLYLYKAIIVPNRDLWPIKLARPHEPGASADRTILGAFSPGPASAKNSSDYALLCRYLDTNANICSIKRLGIKDIEISYDCSLATEPD